MLTLLEEFPRLAHLADYDGRSAAHLAASLADPDLLVMLAEFGSTFFFSDRWGETAAVRARNNPSEAIRQTMLRINSEAAEPKRFKLAAPVRVLEGRLSASTTEARRVNSVDEGRK